MSPKSKLVDTVRKYTSITTLLTAESFANLYDVAETNVPEDSWVAGFSVNPVSALYGNRILVSGSFGVFIPSELVDRAKIARVFAAYNPYPDQIRIMRVRWEAYVYGSRIVIELVHLHESSLSVRIDQQTAIFRCLRGFLMLWPEARLNALCKSELFDHSTLSCCMKLRSSYYQVK